MTTERTFRAMGTTARVVVTSGNERLLDRAQARIDNFQARWSRSRASSEVSRLNQSAGRSVVVSYETFELIRRAVDAWFLTEGRFDPTVMPALVEERHDRSFELLERAADSEADAQGEIDNPPAPIDLSRAEFRVAPGCAEIRLGEAVPSVTLPDGVHIDLGGIGKGYAADLVWAELLSRGAEGALVSIGGDIRCGGQAPSEDGWLIEVDDPFDAGHKLLSLRLKEGAVATTTRIKPAWTQEGARAHRIVDPATGLPANTGLASATVIAAEAWWAEVFAKAAFLAGLKGAAALLGRTDTTGVLVDEAGAVHHLARLSSFAAG
jgi:thiamine biosynthesis lipoprotein